MAGAFVWRGDPEDVWWAYSTAKWFEPLADDEGCVWRGEDYAEAVQYADFWNKKNKLPPAMFQRPRKRRPCPKLSHGDARRIARALLTQEAETLKQARDREAPAGAGVVPAEDVLLLLMHFIHTPGDIRELLHDLTDEEITVVGKKLTKPLEAVADRMTKGEA